MLLLRAERAAGAKRAAVAAAVAGVQQDDRAGEVGGEQLAAFYSGPQL